MHITIETYVLSVLSVIGVFSSWQGVTQGFPSYEGDKVCNVNIVSQPAASIQRSSSVSPEKVESKLLADGRSLQFKQPRFQLDQSLQNDPCLKEQWALKQIQAVQSSHITESGSQILVAILDTGIDQDHEDLNGRVVDEVNFAESPTTDDVYGHGTHVAGIITANSDNNLGIVGLAPESYLLNVKVVDDYGRCDVSALANGIIWAVKNGASVINISVELRESSPRLEDAVDYAWRNGAIVISAAGNQGSENPVYPAYYENCIAVTAIQENGALAPLSNYGDWVEVAAPGFNIYSTLPNNSYGYKHGTSFATAYVSGLAALLFPMVTDINCDGRLNDEVRQVIEAGCREIGIDGAGKGCINIAKSLVEIASACESLP